MRAHSPELNAFLQSIEIRVDAFGVCEIGDEFGLRCGPFDNVVVHFVLGGEGFLECCYGRFPLSPGTAVVIPKNLPKVLSGIGPVKQVRDAMAICVTEHDLVRFRAHDGVPGLVLGCAQLSSAIGEHLPLFEEVKRPIIEHSGNPLLRYLLATMFEELSRPQLGTSAYVSTLMKQVLITLLRSQPDDDTSTLLMSSASLAGVVATVLDRPQDNHTVDSLAETAGMSRSRFCHHFAAAYDCSPMVFVQSVRLAAAARLLRGSGIPVKSVASSVGYASRSQFSRAFQEKYGVTPSCYREDRQISAEPAETSEA